VHAAGTLVASAGPDQRATAGEVVYLDASGTVYKGTSVLTFTWDLGDGSPHGSGMYVEHVYAAPGKFVVTLTASDGVLEGSDACRLDVVPRDDPPHAVIVPAGPLATDRLTAVELDALSSTDDSTAWPTGGRFEWDLGDGTTSQGAAVTHVYTRLGIFVVTLTLTDSGGNIDLNRTTVSVANLPPAGTLASARLDARAGEPVTLSVQASDPDGTVSEVWWDFDASDGVAPQTSGALVQHTYDRKGVYNVTCIVRDNDGGQTVLSAEVHVSAAKARSPLPGDWSLVSAAAIAVASALAATRRKVHRPGASR
jgi:PKD repeat protein